ncbi:MAG TPA: hypothetical protein VJ824_01255 [Bacillota bacterium]|nr:hypothetical protein [Bacillota bacterium]
MSSIHLPAILQKSANRPMTAASLTVHSEEWKALPQQEKQKMSYQVQDVSNGWNASIQRVAYPDINTGQPVFTYKPFFPDEHIIGSQVKDVSIDKNLAPHPISYPNPNTDKPVSTFEPLYPVGLHLDILT